MIFSFNGDCQLCIKFKDILIFSKNSFETNGKINVYPTNDIHLFNFRNYLYFHIMLQMNFSKI